MYSHPIDNWDLKLMKRVMDAMVKKCRKDFMALFLEYDRKEKED